jgi:hypothetical protein
MILPGSYANGFAPRDGMPLYPELWRGCVGAWNPGLGPTGLTLRDWSGRGNHGTLTNMDAAGDWVRSGGRYALDFDGVNDYVITSAISSTVDLSTTKPWTVAAWIQPSFSSSSNVGAAVFDFATNGRAYLRWENSILGFYVDIVQGANGSAWRTNAVSFAANQLMHLAFTHTAANGGQFFLNGIAITTTTVITTAVTGITNNTVSIGRGAVNNYYWSGQIHEVRLHDIVVPQSSLSQQASRRGIAYELAPRRRSSSAVAFNRRRRLLLGST